MSTNTESKISYIRYARLREVAQKALSECLKPLTIDNLSSCFPSLQNNKDGQILLEIIRNHVIEGLKGSSELEIDLILEELQVKEKLDSLDELIYVAQQRKENEQDNKGNFIPVGDLTKEELTESYLVSEKQTFLSELERQRDDLKQRNIKLLRELVELSEDAKTFKNEVDKDMDFIQRLSDFENNDMIKIERDIVSLREDAMKMG